MINALVPGGSFFFKNLFFISAFNHTSQKCLHELIKMDATFDNMGVLPLNHGNNSWMMVSTCFVFLVVVLRFIN